MVSIFSTRSIKIGQNISLNDKVVQKFEVALKKLCLNLAKQIVVDGEGAKKFVTINVINAKSLSSAKNIAFSIANSPLVKTLEDFATCADWELAGGWTTINGERVKDTGVLEKFEMSLAEAQNLVMTARIQLGWVDPSDLASDELPEE